MAAATQGGSGAWLMPRLQLIKLRQLPGVRGLDEWSHLRLRRQAAAYRAWKKRGVETVHTSVKGTDFYRSIDFSHPDNISLRRRLDAPTR